MEIKNKPTMLMILDGFGINPRREGNAIAQAEKPALDHIFENYPSTKLDACGLAVGLPEGQMGNSEVGHLNIGAGRIVYQELTRITASSKAGFSKKSPSSMDLVIRVSSWLPLSYRHITRNMEHLMLLFQQRIWTLLLLQ